MIERTGDLWTYPTIWLCVPTNGETRADGDAVMGAGVAKQAVALCPGIARSLGERLREFGNHVSFLGTWTVNSQTVKIASFPTKDRWKHPAKLDLIRRSAQELRVMRLGGQVVSMPRVGTGHGGLGWSVVEPILRAELPGEEFVVVSEG